MKWVKQTMCNKQNTIKNREGKQLNGTFVCVWHIAASVAVPKMEFQEILRHKEYDMLHSYVLKNMICCRKSYVLKNMICCRQSCPEDYDMLQVVICPEEYDMLQEIICPEEYNMLQAILFPEECTLQEVLCPEEYDLFS